MTFFVWMERAFQYHLRNIESTNNIRNNSNWTYKSKLPIEFLFVSYDLLISFLKYLICWEVIYFASMGRDRNIIIENIKISSRSLNERWELRTSYGSNSKLTKMKICLKFNWATKKSFSGCLRFAQKIFTYHLATGKSPEARDA